MSAASSCRSVPQLPERDARLTRVRTLEEGIGFQPPGSQTTWRRRTKELREQLLVAAGLWPLPSAAIDIGALPNRDDETRELSEIQICGHG